MDKEALEALETLQEQGVGEKGVLSVTVTVCVFRKWHVDNESPYHERLFFLDGISKDSIGTPFFVRAWWPIPLDDLALSDELDQIPMNSVLTLTSDSCTQESAEDFYLDGEEQSVEKGEDSPVFCLGMKAPELREVICASERPNPAA